MRKLKTIFTALLIPAAAAVTITVGAMAAIAMPVSVESTETFNRERTTENISTYSEEFSSLDYTKFTVSANSATLEAKNSSYNHNAKYVWVQINSSLGSKLDYGYTTSSSCKKAAQYSGVITSGRYIGDTYAGDSLLGHPLTEYNIYVKRG